MHRYNSRSHGPHTPDIITLVLGVKESNGSIPDVTTPVKESYKHVPVLTTSVNSLSSRPIATARADPILVARRRHPNSRALGERINNYQGGVDPILVGSQHPSGRSLSAIHPNLIALGLTNPVDGNHATFKRDNLRMNSSDTIPDGYINVEEFGEGMDYKGPSTRVNLPPPPYKIQKSNAPSYFNPHGVPYIIEDKLHFENLDDDNESMLLLNNRDTLSTMTEPTFRELCDERDASYYTPGNLTKLVMTTDAKNATTHQFYTGRKDYRVNVVYNPTKARIIKMPATNNNFIISLVDSIPVQAGRWIIIDTGITLTPTDANYGDCIIAVAKYNAGPPIGVDFYPMIGDVKSTDFRLVLRGYVNQPINVGYILPSFGFQICVYAYRPKENTIEGMNKHFKILENIEGGSYTPTQLANKSLKILKNMSSKMHRLQVKIKATHTSQTKIDPNNILTAVPTNRYMM